MSTDEQIDAIVAAMLGDEMSFESTPAGYVVKIDTSPLIEALQEISEETPSRYFLSDVAGAGIQPGQPWSAFPEVSQDSHNILQNTYSTKACIELYYVPETIEKLFKMDRKFARLPIFKKQGRIFVQLESKASRSPYSSIHEKGLKLLDSNQEWMIHNIKTGNKADIARLRNMAFVSETKLTIYKCKKTGEETQQTKVTGFFPYFSNRSEALGEVMFYFHHKVIMP